MPITDAITKFVDQARIINRQCLSRWCFDVQCKIASVRANRHEIRRERFGFREVGRLLHVLGVSVPGAIQEHLFLFSPGQIRESRRRPLKERAPGGDSDALRMLERIESGAIDLLILMTGVGLAFWRGAIAAL